MNKTGGCGWVWILYSSIMHSHPNAVVLFPNHLLQKLYLTQLLYDLASRLMMTIADCRTRNISSGAWAWILVLYSFLTATQPNPHTLREGYRNREEETEKSVVFCRFLWDPYTGLIDLGNYKCVKILRQKFVSLKI